MPRLYKLTSTAAAQKSLSLQHSGTNLHKHTMPSRILLLVTLALHLIAASAEPATSHFEPQLDLQLVQVLFRNGERNPYPDESYPRDLYSTTSTYNGRLTELGRHRARRFGQTLRRLYAPESSRSLNLNPNDVYTYSVARDSSGESLREVLGVFLDVEPGPVVRGAPLEVDVLLNSRICSKYAVEVDKLRRSPETRRRLAKYEGLYRYVKEKTGLTFDEVSSDERLHKLYRLLESQRSANLSLPDWCPDGVYSLLNEIAFLHYNLESETEMLRRLNGGPLVRRFLEDMTRQRRQTSTNTRRESAWIHLYSGGGHNVAAFARAIGKRYPRVPNYGSAIIVERHGNAVDGFVRILIWTGVTEKLFPIQLRGCPVMCPLSEFARIVAGSLPSDKEMRCLLDDLSE